VFKFQLLYNKNNILYILYNILYIMDLNNLKNMSTNTYIGIFAILFATVIAPRMKDQIVDILNNKIFIIMIFFGIFYLGKQDLMTGVVCAISFFIMYQNVSDKNITDIIMNKTQILVESQPVIVVQEPVQVSQEPVQVVQVSQEPVQEPVVQVIQEPVQVIQEPVQELVQASQEVEKKKVTFSQEVIINNNDEKYNKVKTFIQTILTNNKNVDLKELVSAIINVDPTIEQNMIEQILSQLGITYPK
jgi:hypothetical protein